MRKRHRYGFSLPMVASLTLLVLLLLSLLNEGRIVTAVDADVSLSRIEPVRIKTSSSPITVSDETSQKKILSENHSIIGGRDKMRTWRLRDGNPNRVIDGASFIRLNQAGSRYGAFPGQLAHGVETGTVLAADITMDAVEAMPECDYYKTRICDPYDVVSPCRYCKLRVWTTGLSFPGLGVSLPHCPTIMFSAPEFVLSQVPHVYKRPGKGKWAVCVVKTVPYSSDLPRFNNSGFSTGTPSQNIRNLIIEVVMAFIIFYLQQPVLL